MDRGIQPGRGAPFTGDTPQREALLPPGATDQERAGRPCPSYGTSPSTLRNREGGGGTVRSSKLDLRWRWLGLLARDQSRRDLGHRPAIALQVLADGPGCEFSENEIILQSRADMVLTPAVEARDNTVRTIR